MPESIDTPFHAAPQHGPRPLPLFLQMLRSETAEDPGLRSAALAGLKAYQSAPRPPVPHPPAPPVPSSLAPTSHHRAARAFLRDYGGDGRPIVFVPSLINPPTILDLAPDASLLRWIAARGIHAYLVDWGEPTPADRAMDITAHVETLLMPLLSGLPEPPVLVGYCLGGTIALAAAAAMPVAGLATIAAPWRFDAYGDSARARIGTLWATAKPACEALGVVPMEVLQTGFWQLDPARTIAKYAAFASMPPNSEQALAFVRLEDWANAGSPLSFGAGRELFEDFLAANKPGNGGWVIGGGPVNPSALDCPAIEFLSTSDRIVPAATAAGLPERRESRAGHVGMVIGGRARADLWEPLAHWIAGLDTVR